MALNAPSAEPAAKGTEVCPYAAVGFWVLDNLPDVHSLGLGFGVSELGGRDWAWEVFFHFLTIGSPLHPNVPKKGSTIFRKPNSRTYP